MPRELTYDSIIIKKQPFGEADEIITVLGRDVGKMRLLVKSSKLPTSKLQYGLQPSFHASLTVVGSGSLPKIIRVQPVELFPGLQDQSEKIQAWFVAAELIIKGLGDEERNQELFELVLRFLRFLDAAPSDLVAAGLLKFKLDFMAAIGLGIHAPARLETEILFSASRGGFYSGQLSHDSKSTTVAVWDTFLGLRQQGFEQVPSWSENLEQLREFVGNFISYQLERDLKAEKFLDDSSRDIIDKR